MERGLLIVISGFAGSGKGTIMKNLLDKHEGYALSISATTRSPRPMEVDGREYFFVTRDRFEEMIANDEMLEYAEYVNNYYGTPVSFVDEKRDEGKDVILEIEIQGALQIKEKYPDAILIFITPPSAKILRDRLVGRGTETEDVIEKRLSRATVESEGVEAYDYILINDTVDTCTEKLHNLIRAQHDRSRYHLDIIDKIREDLRRR